MTTVDSDSNAEPVESLETEPAGHSQEAPQASGTEGVRSTDSIIDRVERALARAEQILLTPVLKVREPVLKVRAMARAKNAELGLEPRADPPWVSFLRRPVAGPVSCLVAMMAVYIGVFGTLTYQQQSNYGTFGFDMGIYDQGIWLVSHFKDPFDTIRGLDYFGHHVNLITLSFVPAYWFGAGPHFLYAVETVWMALGAIPIWLLGRDRLHSAWTALGLSAAYLLYPSLEWINWWHFHPDALIITPLMFAYWLATRKLWGWFWICVAIALACKEDAGLAVFGLGLCVWFKHRQRARGLLTAIVGAAWFLICTKVIIPFANGGGQPFYVSFFPGFGSSIFSIAGNLVLHPSKWLRLALSRSRWTYYAQLFWPVALVALLEPLVMLIALPQLFFNVISAQSYTHNIHFYYSSIVIAGIFLAAVEACARRGRTPSGQRFAVGLVVAAALASNVAWSPSPISVNFHSGIWAAPAPKDKAINRAIQIVPKDASVSATYNIDDHMTHRTLIYEFPNPWVPTYWGLPNSKPADPSKVDWLVLDTAVTGNQSALYSDLLDKHEFQPVFSNDGILVLHRVRPGVPNDHDWP